MVWFALIFIILWFWFWIKIILAIARHSLRISTKKKFKSEVIIGDGKKYKNISDEKLDQFKVSDIDTFKTFFSNMFIDFEKAYNNLDYSLMKQLCTSELYSDYYTGISLDLKVGNKKIISDMEIKDIVIFDANSNYTADIISTMIEIKYITYTINKDGKVINGNRTRPIKEKFEVIFKKNSNSSAEKTCPNCGSKITGAKCEYCRYETKKEDYLISSIKKII